MIANSTSVVSISSSQTLQSSLTAEPQVIERAQLAEALIPRKAVDEFTLGINAAMVALLSAHGATSQNSLLLKRLKAYAARGDVANRLTLRLA